MKKLLSLLSLFLVKLSKRPLVKIRLNHSSSGLDKIDCLYVINLKRRSEKWKETNAALKEHGLTPNRVDAIDGWKIPKRKWLCLTGFYSKNMTGGKVGCFLSHLSCLKDALDRDFKMIWVMEDDIEAVRPPQEMIRLIKQLDEIDPHWDVLYSDLDTRRDSGADKRPRSVQPYDFDNPYINLNSRKKHFRRVSVNKKIRKTGFRWGMYSAIISRRGIKKIYKEFSKAPLWRPYDHLVHYVPGIREYSSIQRVVTVRSDRLISDTQRLN